MADFSSGVRLSAANIWLRVWPGRGGALLERRERPGGLLGQVQRAGQVLDHRLAHDLAHLVVVVADEGVEHQRHVAVARMSALSPRVTVDGELLGELLHALTQQVGEHAGSRRAPARRNVSGFPATVTQTGSSA